MRPVSIAFNQSQWASIERLVAERNCSIGAAVRLLVDAGIVAVATAKPNGAAK